MERHYLQPCAWRSHRAATAGSISLRSFNQARSLIWCCWGSRGICPARRSRRGRGAGLPFGGWRLAAVAEAVASAGEGGEGAARGLHQSATVAGQNLPRQSWLSAAVHLPRIWAFPAWEQDVTEARGCFGGSAQYHSNALLTSIILLALSCHAA